MTPEEKYRQLYEEMFNLCKENGWGDPFSYSRGKEIYMATILNHKVATTYSGADAFDSDGACEYKSTITGNLCGTYNGISVQPTLEEQVSYIKNEKIGPYRNHYFARFENGTVAEIYMMTNDQVLNLLLPKIENQYIKRQTKKTKDPRLGVTLTTAEIKKQGKKIYGN